MTANAAAKLLEAAIAFDELRVKGLRLQRERNALECAAPSVVSLRGAACWRSEPDVWCASCLERERLHRELLGVRAHRGWALRRFSQWRQRYQELQLSLDEAVTA